MDQTPAFCVGDGMTMFMSGFMSSLRRRWWRTTHADRTETPPCINLFFPSWTLTSEAKYLGACAGIFALGVAVEALAAARRKRHHPMRPIEGALLYGLQITLGYALMLAAMSYAVELFVCVILGVVVGNYLFRGTAAKTAASDAACCAGLDDLEGGYTKLDDSPETTSSFCPESLAVSIPGMTCDTCVRTVHACLLNCTGVRAVKVDLTTKRAVVYGSPDVIQLFTALDRAGYPHT